MAGSIIGGRRGGTWRLLGVAALALGTAGSLAASPARASTGQAYASPARTSTAHAAATQAAATDTAATQAGPHLWRPAPAGTALRTGTAVQATPGPRTGTALQTTPRPRTGTEAVPAPPANPAPPASAASPAGSGPGAWHTQPTPNPGQLPNGTLLATSCTGVSTCTAVGDFDNPAGVLVTLAERWNGTGWAIEPTPNPAGAGGSQLSAVSCVSARSCTAAGYDTDASGAIVPLIEVWNGSTWRIQATPRPTGATESGFFGVSCTAAGACTADGDYTTATGSSLPLAERWDGSTWRLQPTPAPSGASASGLFAVSCPSATSCTAAGASTDSSGSTTTLAERWDGSTWSVKATPMPAGATGGQFGGVSCTAAAACTAVGYSDSSDGTVRALAERWSGGAWKVQPTPAPSGAADTELAAVSCVSAQDCTAAGAYADASTRSTVTLAETWHGRAWKVQATPNPAHAGGSELIAVSCPAATSCTAAGQFANLAGTTLPLAATWHAGSWALQPPDRPQGSRGGELTGVSCPAATSCTAVGDYNKTSKGSVPLAESWDGTRWSIRPTPVPAASVSSALQAVSCPSAAACTAVGHYYLHPAGPAVTLAETWRGSAWHVQATPNPAGAGYSSLTAVSCSAPAACTAVGTYHGKGGIPQALVERWNGSRWASQSLATPAGATVSTVAGVSCTSATACVASGYYDTSSGSARPLVEVWNGAGWHIQHVPLPAGSQGGTLTAVSCTAANACTATGSYYASPGGSLAERWNGTAWAVQATPNPPDAGASASEITFATVACASAHACVATGNYTPDQRPASFAAAWNGTAWHLRALGLPPGTIGSTVYGAACSATRCTAVGSHFGSSDQSVTLALGAKA